MNEDPRRAESHFRAALALLPDRDTVHFGLALCLLAQGNQAHAIRELALECLVNPAFVASPWWTQEPFGPLKTAAIAQLFKDYAFAIQHPNTPEWRKPQLAYAAAFTRWWLGGRVPDQTELKGALPYQQPFFEQLRAFRDGQPLKKLPPWDLLDQARQDPAHAGAILRSPAKPLPAGALTGALARIANSPADLADLLRAPAPGGIGIVRQQMNRGHYSIMNNVLDGPGYEDLAPRVFDAFTTTFATPLFPLRSAIPGPVMSDLMTRP